MTAVIPDGPGSLPAVTPSGNFAEMPRVADAARLALAARKEVRVRWTLSRHARRLLTLAAAAVVVAVITRRVEFAGLAAPALLLLGAGRPSRPAKLAVRVRPTTTRLHEDEPAAVDVALDTWITGSAEAGAQGRGEHEVRWILHAGHGIDPDGATSVIGDAARFTFTVPRWGKRPVGSVEAVLHDRWRLTEGRFTLPLPALDVYPHPAIQRTHVVLSRLPNRLGEHSARVPGEGTEFTGVREYVPGDRQRQINWPASTRRGRLQVNTFAAERSQDVVLMVDATSDVGEPGSSALDLALRGASGAARAYLDARDRVGVITYQWGGARWLAPGLGKRQVYRIIDAMLAADASWSRGAVLHRLPRAALPPGALVVVFSPLLDQRFVEALRDMRERGFALMVVDVLNVDPPASRFSFVDDMAARIWRMEQQAIRFSLRELGIPVVHWDGVSPLDLPLAPYTRRPVVIRR
jgi:uncharacterized protein (DUF58 family)